MRGWIGRGIVVGAALGIAVGVACEGGPEGVGAGEFDAELADSLVRRQMEFGPRVPGTAAHAAALEWMTAYLAERADAVEQIPFTHVTTVGDTLRLTNVFARFRPEVASRVLLLAHWDSRPVSERSADAADRALPLPGANDGASGVAILLTIADALAASPPGVGVDILLTDGEDWGHDPVTFATRIEDMLLGARHFADTRGDTYRPLYGILLDLVGDQSPRFPREGNSMAYAPEVVGRVWDKADELGYGDIFVDVIGQSIVDDHLPLNEAGIRTINVIDFDYPYWHTREDTADKVSARTLDVVGEVVLAVIREQGGP
ncbi:MAG TPA: M28 family peptidase [Gemmatimonadota bacterium]|nr:M28 family peptidase [Gemmatimonadota bacterium]